MAKKAISVTLERDNLFWLKGQVQGGRRRSISDALDEVVTAARRSGTSGDLRSVIGTIDLAPDDSGLEQADTYLESVFSRSLARPVPVEEKAATSKASAARTGGARSRPAKPRRG